MGQSSFSKNLTAILSELFNVNMGAAKKIEDAIKSVPEESISFVKGIKEGAVGEYKYENAMPTYDKKVMDAAGEDAQSAMAEMKSNDIYTSGEYFKIRGKEIDEEVDMQFKKQYRVELNALKSSVSRNDIDLASKIAIGSGMEKTDIDKLLTNEDYTGLQSQIKTNLRNKFENQYLTAVELEARNTNMSDLEIRELYSKYGSTKDRIKALRLETKLAYQASGVTDNVEFNAPKGVKFFLEWMGSTKGLLGNLHQSAQKVGLKSVAHVFEGMHKLVDNQSTLGSYIKEHRNSMRNLTFSYGDKASQLREYIESTEPVSQLKVSYGASEHTLAVKPSAIKNLGVDLKTPEGIQFVKDATRINNSFQAVNEMMAHIHMNKYDAPSMRSKFAELDDSRWSVGMKRNGAANDAEIQLTERAYNRDNYFPIVINENYKNRLKTKMDPLFDEDLKKAIGELPDDYDHHAVFSSFEKRRGTASGASIKENRMMPHEEIDHYFNSVNYTMFKKKLKGDIETVQRMLFMPIGEKSDRSALSKRLSDLADHVDNAYKIPKAQEDYTTPEMLIKGYSRIATVVALAKPQMVLFANMTQSVMNAGMYRGNYLMGYAKGLQKTLSLMGNGVSEITKQVTSGEGVNLDKAFKNILLGKYDSNSMEYEVMRDVVQKNTQTFMDEDIMRMIGTDILDSKKKATGRLSKLLNASMYGMQFSDKVSRGTSAMLAIEYGKEQYEKLVKDIAMVNAGTMKLRDAQANFAKNIHINQFASDPMIKKNIMDSINYVNPSVTQKDFLKTFANAAILQENFDYTNAGIPLFNSMIKAKGGVAAAAAITFTSYPQYYITNVFRGVLASYKNGDAKPLVNLAAFGAMLNFAMSTIEEESDNEAVKDSANYVRTLSPYYTVTAPVMKAIQSPAGIMTAPIALGLLAALKATNAVNESMGIDEAPIDGYQKMMLRNMGQNEIITKSMDNYKKTFLDPVLEGISED